MSFREGIAAGLASIRQAQAVSVVYVCGTFRLPLVVGVGRSQQVFEGTEEGNVNQYSAFERDFLVGVSDLVMDGLRIEPQAGALIEETLDGETVQVWQIVNQDGLPPWQYSDGGQTQYRIHVVKVGEDEP